MSDRQGLFIKPSPPVTTDDKLNAFYVFFASYMRQWARLLETALVFNNTSGPNTQTGNAYSVVPADIDIIANNTLATMTVTLPTPSTCPGRNLWIKTTKAQTVVSASSNVVPLAGGAAGTAILAATAGKYARLVSDGTNWVVMDAN